VCAHCGRAFAWRKAWARSWDRVRLCSDRCRRARLDETDDALERALEALCAARASVCPSEAARRVAGDDEAAWRPLMERARMAARRLADRGVAEITQGGRVVDPSHARGAIRVRARRGRA
jgi:hypothetical protein